MIANLRWTDAARDAAARGEQAVLVTVAAAAGSTPREAGATMVVTRDGQAGTIGGGHLEFEALRLAREALAAGTRGAWAVRFPLAARLGQCCGGVATLAFATLGDDAPAWLDAVAEHHRAGVGCVVAMRLQPGDPTRLVVTTQHARGSLGTGTLDAAVVAAARARLADASSADASSAGAALADVAGADMLLHLVPPPAFPVVVFGNGHVGHALVHVLGALPVDVQWVDAREHDFPAQVPGNVTVVATDDPVAEVASAPRGAALVVMTHSHALDFDIVEAALRRDDFAYVGLIGSRAKRAQFERRLHQRGAGAIAPGRVTCPIGAMLPGKEPGVIAVGVAAELLQLRAQRTLSGHAPVAAGTPIGARMRASSPTAPRSE